MHHASGRHAPFHRNGCTIRAEPVHHLLRSYCTLGAVYATCKLFGENSFPEADRFVNIGPVSNEPEFENFFNICNRCFVESIEKYGKSLGKKKYFWNEIKSTYPALFDVLHRIKVYRHSSDHLELNPDVAKKYKEFWNEDTAGVTDFEEQRFVIQQKLLEAFLSAIQTEIDSIS